MDYLHSLAPVDAGSWYAASMPEIKELDLCEHGHDNDFAIQAPAVQSGDMLAIALASAASSGQAWSIAQAPEGVVLMTSSVTRPIVDNDEDGQPIVSETATTSFLIAIQQTLESGAKLVLACTQPGRSPINAVIAF